MIKLTKNQCSSSLAACPHDPQNQHRNPVVLYLGHLGANRGKESNRRNTPSAENLLGGTVTKQWNPSICWYFQRLLYLYLLVISWVSTISSYFICGCKFKGGNGDTKTTSTILHLRQNLRSQTEAPKRSERFDEFCFFGVWFFASKNIGFLWFLYFENPGTGEMPEMPSLKLAASRKMKIALGRWNFRLGSGVMLVSGNVDNFETRTIY